MNPRDRDRVEADSSDHDVTYTLLTILLVALMVSSLITIWTMAARIAATGAAQ